MTVEFSRPEAWGFAALLAVVIALYLWERRHARVEVASLLLWEPLPDEPIRRSRFRPDRLFVLQFALLTLLVLGFAQPRWRNPGSDPAARRQIFVLDTSASMAAREGGQTRFEAAADIIRRQLAEILPHGRVALVAAGRRPRLIAPFTTEASEILRRLDETSPEHAAANLNWALTLARSLADAGEGPVEIELITDAAPSELAPEWLHGVALLPVGRTDDNLGIVGIEVEQGRFDGPQAARARVLVQNFSGRERHGTLRLDLDQVVLDRWGFSLTPGERRTFTLGAIPASGVLHAQLGLEDALEVDNEAFAWVRPEQRLRLLVVTESRKLQETMESMQRALPELECRFVAPSAYAPGPDHAADVTLFHRYVPRELPKGTLLLTAAPSSSPLCASDEKLRRLPIMDWASGHPALRDLRVFPPMSVSAPERLEVPPWAETLLRSRGETGDVALAFAGVTSGRRIACLSFDLADRNLLGPDDAGLLVFLLDLLDWLAPADNPVVVERSGSAGTMLATPGETFTVTDPAGHVSSLVSSGTVNVEMPIAGIYSLESPRRRVRILANFLDPQESDIGRPARAPVAAPASRRSGHGSPPQHDSFDRWLYAIVAAGLIVEWVVARRTQ